MADLRIVDSDNVHTLPVAGLRNVVAAVHAFAECIDDGSMTARRCILIVQDADELVDFTTFGEDFDSAQAIGFLEMVKAKIIAGSWR